ncbi:MAG: uracil-DNA glycosylase [Zetaproteobacteria bacterium]|nr:uracil-DNA glycosylase [Pseudobdellovibrionaceae bacterium]|tara:strand:- start:970 stop:1674 length:705 start_codon:yes stop_codon:yes gene_type:complete
MENQDKIKKNNDIGLSGEWKEHLLDQFSKDYMKKLKKFLVNEKKVGKVIYPKGQDIFNAFNLTQFSQVKVVILGQDPYHGEGQAHGLSFSVPRGMKVPPSLVNIIKEITREKNEPRPDHGCLKSWAEQGVLLLNSVLTVERKKPGSHQGKGWESFTDRVIEVLNLKKENLVFLLWGAYAQKKCSKIDTNRHYVLTSSHPSPFSVYRGFMGCQHFEKTNEYLKKHKKKPIMWLPL